MPFRAQFLPTKSAREDINPFQNHILSTGSRWYIDDSKLARLGRLAFLVRLGRLSLPVFLGGSGHHCSRVCHRNTSRNSFLTNTEIAGIVRETHQAFMILMKILCSSKSRWISRNYVLFPVPLAILENDNEEKKHDTKSES